MKRTEHYDLPTWEKTDRVLMSDFNDMTGKLDAALATIPKIETGTYTGDGTVDRLIELPFTPKVVYQGNEVGRTSSSFTSERFGGVALTGKPVIYGDSYKILEIVEGGFQVSHWTSTTTNNHENMEYRYIAIG